HRQGGVEADLHDVGLAVAVHVGDLQRGGAVEGVEELGGIKTLGRGHPAISEGRPPRDAAGQVSSAVDAGPRKDRALSGRSARGGSLAWIDWRHYPHKPRAGPRHRRPIGNAASRPGMTQPPCVAVTGAGAGVNAPAGPGNATGLSNPSAETAATPK